MLSRRFLAVCQKVRLNSGPFLLVKIAGFVPELQSSS